MWQKWLAGFISGVLRNPLETAAIKTIVDADPTIPQVVKDDLDVAVALGQIYENKQNGTLVYKYSDGTTPDLTITSIKF